MGISTQSSHGHESNSLYDIIISNLPISTMDKIKEKYPEVIDVLNGTTDVEMSYTDTYTPYNDEERQEKYKRVRSFFESQSYDYMVEFLSSFENPFFIKWAKTGLPNSDKAIIYHAALDVKEKKYFSMPHEPSPPYDNRQHIDA